MDRISKPCAIRAKNRTFRARYLDQLTKQENQICREAGARSQWLCCRTQILIQIGDQCRLRATASWWTCLMTRQTWCEVAGQRRWIVSQSPARYARRTGPFARVTSTSLPSRRIRYAEKQVLGLNGYVAVLRY